MDAKNTKVQKHQDLLGKLKTWLRDRNLLNDEFETLLGTLDDDQALTTPQSLWLAFSQTIARLWPFHLQADLFRLLGTHCSQDNPLAAWCPQSIDIENANITQFCARLGLANYTDLYRFSVEKRQEFWKQTLYELGVVLNNKDEVVFNEKAGMETNSWWPNASLNIAESCFLAAPDSPAIVWQKEGHSQLMTWTYAELNVHSKKVAGALMKLGYKAGARIAIDMPMTANAVAIYLGIIRMGGVVVSIADSFAPQEIATRLRISQAQAIFTQDAIARGQKRLPLYSRVVEASSPRAIVLPLDPDSRDTVQLRPDDLWWEQFLSATDSEIDFEYATMDSELNILFSSGTTSDPKAIPWTHLTPIKCAMDGYFHLDIHPGDRVAWPTNLGWMMGPWLIFATLINRGTIALFDGLPTGAEFGDFVEKAQVNILGLVPSIVKSWRASGCMEGKNWSSLRHFSSTGEASSPDDYLYLMSLAGYHPVIEYCGGTEIGGGYITSTVVQNNLPSTFSTPALGLEMYILNENNQISDQGEVYLRGPSPGLSNRLLNADHHQVYYAGTPALNGKELRRHGDELTRLPNGFWQALGRADDTMNLGGIKISSAEIERLMNTHPAILETAAIALSPAGGGPSHLHACIVLKNSGAVVDASELLQNLQLIINRELNPLFKIQKLHILDSLPRTASNKVMRRVLRDQFSQTS